MFRRVMIVAELHRVTLWTVYHYIEPRIDVFAAHFINRFDPPAEVWLLLASLSLFVRNHLMHVQ
ncbi:MAG: hypothetical protein ABI690_14555 [Chloroflexota bacterium]